MKTWVLFIEAQRIIGCDYRTLRNHVRRGRIAVHVDPEQFPLYRREDCERVAREKAARAR
jgi:predicted site-specific integrase-resolvase